MTTEDRAREAFITDCVARGYHPDRIAEWTRDYYTCAFLAGRASAEAEIAKLYERINELLYSREKTNAD